MKIRGLFHIHTTCSHDGRLEPATIREKALSFGCGFAVVCDHAEDLTPDRYQRLREDCGKVSDGKFLLVPGLEYAFGRIHLLGIGVKRCIPAAEPEECLEKIRGEGGMTVWAHPFLPDVLRHERWDLLDGIEVWSARYGTKYVPSADLCRAVRALREGGASLSAYAGLDAHRGDQMKPLCLEVEMEELDQETLLSELRGGRFSLCFGRFTVPSTGKLGIWQKALFPIVHGAYRAAEKAIDVLSRHFCREKAQKAQED
jgi:predicted metal-dependent phosphoesterase TrpH